MMEIYCLYFFAFIGFIMGYYWNMKRDKSSNFAGNDDQLQFQNILTMDKDKITALGFN